MLFIQLIAVFFVIGLFGFGGGAAMVSLIQGEVVAHYGWLTIAEFTDVVAVSQVTPGPIGINVATYVGYTAVVNAGYAPWVGMVGSACATLAMVAPSVAIMAVVSAFILRHRDHWMVQGVFSGLRPAVAGLLAAAALAMMQEENFGNPHTAPRRFVVSVAIYLVTIFAYYRYRPSPIALIAVSGLLGALIYG
ncbi:MAG: chromate transporter [Bacteroidales bacterium]|nr:chromate transporter [Bacteroidales bacterium]